jgi:hypothetical protein
MIERLYANFRYSLRIIQMIAGPSYDRLNINAAWCSARAMRGLKR